MKRKIIGWGLVGTPIAAFLVGLWLTTSPWIALIVAIGTPLTLLFVGCIIKGVDILGGE